MDNKAPNTELKAFIKTIGDFLHQVNPNTDYQSELKRDIQYVINALEKDDIELWITCSENISTKYSTILTRKGFSYLTEDTIRKLGKEWIYNNLKTIALALDSDLKVTCLTSAATKGFMEYAVEKAIR